jgi:hypothetical protein
LSFGTSDNPILQSKGGLTFSMLFSPSEEPSDSRLFRLFFDDGEGSFTITIEPLKILLMLLCQLLFALPTFAAKARVGEDLKIGIATR